MSSCRGVSAQSSSMITFRSFFTSPLRTISLFFLISLSFNPKYSAYEPRLVLISECKSQTRVKRGKIESCVLSILLPRHRFYTASTRSWLISSNFKSANQFLTSRLAKISETKVGPARCKMFCTSYCSRLNPPARNFKARFPCPMTLYFCEFHASSVQKVSSNI